MGGPSAIQAFLTETYAVDVSPDFISTVTDAIVAEVTAWQSRPLEPLYPVVFCDARRVTSRDDAVVRSKAVSLAVAVLPDGSRDMLGIWIEPTEGATFWMQVFTDLKTRGCQDMLIAVTDGLKGMSDALAAVFPATTNSSGSPGDAHFPPWSRRGGAPGRTSDGATTLRWLALRNLTANWQRTASAWSHAMNQVAILYGDRFTSAT